ncbi:two component transcriptional regulator, LuxR family [Brevibacillus laterosporus GI-9]|nr:two component transcriptional regulator, LuxR family [Brevibacillus laterosporus GI-9]
MLKSIHPREMKEALKLIYNGGIWIDQSVTTRVFEEMKRQREQLKKDRLKSEKRSVRAYETRDGDSGASVKRTALQIDRRQATFIGGNDPQLLLDSLLEAWRQKS